MASPYCGFGGDMNKGTLYCYRLDEVTGVISSFEILESEWSIREHFHNHDRDEFVFWKNLGTGANYSYSVQRRTLDKYISNKVYTFDPDPQHAQNIIEEALSAKLKKARLEVKKYTKILKLIQNNKLGD